MNSEKSTIHLPKLGIALAIGSIAMAVSSKLVKERHTKHHATISIAIGLLSGAITYFCLPTNKNSSATKLDSGSDLLLPQFDYDRTKYAGKILTTLSIPDGTYDAGWTGYSIYINTPNGIMEAKTDVGIKSPFPVPFVVGVNNGIGFILNKDYSTDSNILSPEIISYYKNKFPSQTYF